MACDARLRAMCCAQGLWMACKGSGVQIPSAPLFLAPHSCRSAGVASEQRSVRRSDSQRGRVSNSLLRPGRWPSCVGGTYVGEWQRVLASRFAQQGKLRCCEEFLDDFKPPGGRTLRRPVASSLPPAGAWRGTAISVYTPHPGGAPRPPLLRHPIADCMTGPARRQQAAGRWRRRASPHDQGTSQ
jgi:hypothetical protein